MRVLVGLGLGLLCAAVLSCARAQKGAQSAPPSAMEAGTPPTPMGDNPRAEIDRLDQAIDDELAKLRVSPRVPDCIGTTTCAEIAAVPLVEKPIADDPTCRPGPTDTCKSVCTLHDSICDNASRICELAKQLGGADAYANGKCAKGKASCDTARERCCSCV